jgi:hypothetical protein
VHNNSLGTHNKVVLFLTDFSQNAFVISAITCYFIET